jgi:hypothetical protein
MTVFIDGIVLTRKFPSGSIPELCGMRSMAYLQPGDVDKDGKKIVELTPLGERLYTSWIHGSHDSKVQLASDGTTLSMKGNPGRFGRTDNLFNLDFEGTIKAANRIAHSQGFPVDSFQPGERDPYTRSQLEKIWASRVDESRQPLHVAEGWKLHDDDGNELQSKKRASAREQDIESPWTGARVWSIHMTQNYRTGSPENARAILEWANTQTVQRVKKARLGPTTVVWGKLSYCQIELYVKADEMLAHAKGPQAKAEVLSSPAYQYALENGIIRLEVKCAKDFLKHRNLTYLGNWDMGTVTNLFAEKAEILHRCSVSVAAEDEDILALLPSSTRVHAAAWMAGVDVSAHMSRRTFFRHAKVLRQYGIDICEKRNITVVRPKLREVEVTPVAAPHWYSLSAA